MKKRKKTPRPETLHQHSSKHCTGQWHCQPGGMVPQRLTTISLGRWSTCHTVHSTPQQTWTHFRHHGMQASQFTLCEIRCRMVATCTPCCTSKQQHQLQHLWAFHTVTCNLAMIVSAGQLGRHNWQWRPDIAGSFSSAVGCPVTAPLLSEDPGRVNDPPSRLELPEVPVT